MKETEVISRRALLVKQHDSIPIYLFALTADELDQIADISRVERNDVGDLIGYQRPEVRRHIKNIVDYLDSDNPILPNAIVLSVNPSVKFTKSRGPNTDDGITAVGTIEIPIPSPSGKKPAFIVDGQQRIAALQSAKNRSFPVPMTAFVAETVDLQRDQFVRVNSSKPLPSGLVTELLPLISAPIPASLTARQLPSAIVDQLNQSPDSPFKGLIKRPSMSQKEKKASPITDTSLVKALQEALKSPSSCLFPYKNLTTGETDIDGIWALLICYWSAVKAVFPEAWGLPATKSRLMHGVGIQSMARLMDRIMATTDPTSKGASAKVEKELQLISSQCAWTKGTWEALDRQPWNSLQNVPRDINRLSNHLVRAYVSAKSNN